MPDLIRKEIKKIFRNINIKKSTIIGFDFDIEKYVNVKDLVNKYNELNSNDQRVIYKRLVNNITFLNPAFHSNEYLYKNTVNELFDTYCYIKRLVNKDESRL